MTLEELTGIVNRHDPIDLLRLGAPEDEYQAEVGAIFALLGRKEFSEAELAVEIKEIFIQWFSESTVQNHGVEVYRSMARDILKEGTKRK